MLKCPQVLDQLHCNRCPLISWWQGRFLEPLVLIAPLCFKLKQKSLFSGLGPFPSSTISFSGPHPMTENVSKRFQGRVKSSQVRALIISCDSFSPLANDRRTSPQLTDYQTLRPSVQKVLIATLHISKWKYEKQPLTDYETPNLNCRIFEVLY